MECPHCTVTFHEEWEEMIHNPARDEKQELYWRVTICPDCKEPTMKIGMRKISQPFLTNEDYFMVYPQFPKRSPVDDSVPEAFKVDYIEACNVLPISAKASAALSRRVLQGILKQNGYTSSNLARQIDAALSEGDPQKSLPPTIRKTIDAVRNFGNFAAHPITDQTSLQVIDVENGEAEWCLEIVEALFNHYYIQPALNAKRIDALNERLKGAGKPPVKS